MLLGQYIKRNMPDAVELNDMIPVQARDMLLARWR